MSSLFGIDRNRTVCFSGNALHRFPFSLTDKENPCYLNLLSEINNAILYTLKAGYRYFLCSMEQGFDLLCAKIFLDIRKEHQRFSKAVLISVLPHGSCKHYASWSKMYKSVIKKAGKIVKAMQLDTEHSYFLCNLYMIENAKYLICYSDGRERTTKRILEIAKSKNLIIDNLATHC